LRHSSMLSAAVLIAAILMIVVIWKTSVWSFQSGIPFEQREL
jgi:hypothetical protein